MNATVNGKARTLADGITLEDLLRDLDVAPAGIAIAVNDRVVRRATYATHALVDGDAIEIIRAVAGG